MTRTLLLALGLAACSGNSTSDKELSDLRAELVDQRAEMRSMRQEIRDLRESLPKSTAPAEADADPEPDAPPDAPAAAPKTPAAPAAPDPKAAPADKPATPPAQGSVNIQVESNPAGAVVFLADKMVGTTPVILKTPVGTSEISVRLEKSGYRPRLMTLRPEEDTKISVQLAKKSN